MKQQTLAPRLGEPVGKGMLFIVSFPRSGSHLVRFIVEYVTGRPTLGCAGNEVDKPIHTNTFIEEPDVLAHVGGSPIAGKAHFASELEGVLVDGLMLIRRDPVEAVLAHSRRWSFDPFRFRYKRVVKKNASLHFDLLRYFDGFAGPKVALSYEMLISADAGKYLPEIDKMAMMLGASADGTRLATMRADFDRLRRVNADVTARPWAGFRSQADPVHYRVNCHPALVKIVERAVAAAQPA